MDELDKIKNQVVSCTLCNLCKNRINAVPGRGSHDAKVIFVGEAPGRFEDIKGEPFVGPAGKKLDEALRQAGFDKNSVYITNVVKCRPPNNRVPHIVEVESCHDYLDKEISLIKPTIVCILGNTAYGSLLGGANISKNRGKIIERNGVLYFLTYHPAAVIYNKNLFEVLKKDLDKLRETVTHLKNGKVVKPDIEITS
ncbi:MAG: uracil-DNA glycosylase [Nitrosopumilaceae archaeon]|nr:uracil-DNA glycosylase [Nitrosopumilaceae archaeon]NIU00595.1 uracil-DNA glycosylase [Nitrosopumilaceae archaeon]NIU86981.1 uracil-DNA glycosylase [Nitrosopumilaceae archaeon]NIV66445.1 uracil-DNA glycosylase [Nitrosopumilaceae archaeon]NIX61197.1 uracil-DNA glycosylase [Nitrosopumilaceae archaeon]